MQSIKWKGVWWWRWNTFTGSMKLDFIRCQKLAHRRSNSCSDFTVVPNKLRSNSGASQVIQWWRTHLPVQETRVWSLGWEDTLEKEMATHSSTLAWKIPWTEEHGRLLQSMGSKRVRHDWATSVTCLTGKFQPSPRPILWVGWLSNLDTFLSDERIDLAKNCHNSHTNSEAKPSFYV